LLSSFPYRAPNRKEAQNDEAPPFEIGSLLTIPLRDRL